ncbi:MAG: SNF2 helicase associated domain-containing protein [Schwartzia sp.]|nr:SNF2 helicase associated domain-containing protein [Schwartzia sp. (in: firmicutes)]
MLQETEIRSLANDASYERGCRYFHNGAVKRLRTEKVTGTQYHYEALVQGTDTYIAWADVRNTAKVTDFGCDCPASTLYDGACKHVVALLKALQERQAVQRAPEPRDSLGERLFSLVRRRAAVAPPPLSLEPKLCVANEYGHQTVWLEFRLGRDRLYIIRSISEMMRSLATGQPIAFGKNLVLRPEEFVFAPGRSAALWDFLRSAWRDAESARAYSSYFRSNFSSGSLFEQKRLKLSPSNLTRFLDIMGDEAFEVVPDSMDAVTVQVTDGVPPLSVSVEDIGNGARVGLDAGRSLRLLDEEGRFILCGDIIYRTPPEEGDRLRTLITAFAGRRYLTVALNRLEDFFATVLPELEKSATVQVAPAFSRRFEILPLAAEVFLDYHGDGVAARLSYRYGDTAYNPLAGPPPTRTGTRRLIRDVAAEEDIRALFDTYGFLPEDGQLVQPEEEPAYDFLTEGLPALSRMADVFYSEIFHRRPVRTMPPVTIGVSLQKDNLLEVRLSARDIDFDELVGILRSYRLKRRYHRLKDGSFVTLGEQQMDALADLVETTGIRGGDGQVANLPMAQALYIDALAREESGLTIESSRDFRDLVRDIAKPDAMDWTPPAEVAPVLRGYQATGFAWLMSLAAHGLGGILADDMGLGKTLQVIAFILARREESPLPTLVITPTSLMYNWLDEIQRFAPVLRATAVAGTKAERRALLEQAADFDVVVTTYNMLKRDISDYEQRRFAFCFLDEAQHIKNPATQNAKAVKRLQTGGYFALTGTPIENSLTELWSIFDFLMPGYLGPHAQFRGRYEVPIVRGEDERAAKNLRRRVAPFILRRLKKDVLTELPDKVESKVVNEMTPQQAGVYKAWFVQSQKEFAAILKEHGFDSGRIKILAILTRLRQIACDPAIFLEDYDGGSGKLDLLADIVPEAIAGGHRLLIFSQFTTMLRRIEERLREMDIACHYLDGQTPALERLRLVKEFNAGGKPVFLISLKAGGTGLNLTGADMVIHYDPWWNPAVEDQATDRAYRIGQQNKVQVLKLVTKGTIEEKIFALQDRKKALIDQMIQPGENFLSKLDENEIRDLFR